MMYHAKAKENQCNGIGEKKNSVHNWFVNGEPKTNYMQAEW